MAATARASGSRLGEGVRLAERADIRSSDIGRFSSIGRDTKVVESTIGNFCAVSWDVTINAIAHPLDHATVSGFPYASRMGFVPANVSGDRLKVTLGHDVWIGAHAVLLPGVTVATGAVIGAGAVVTRDVEPYTIVTGVPARPLRPRFVPEVTEELLASQWWFAPTQLLRDNVHLFQVPTTPSIAREIVARLGPGARGTLPE